LYQNSFTGIDQYAAKLIRTKARQLVGKAGLTEDDRDDLEQDLILDLLQRMHKYNPDRSKKITYMTRIVERRISTILNDRYAMCRDWRQCSCSLNDLVFNQEGDFSELSELLGNDGFIESVGKETREERNNDILLDIQKVINTLSTDLQDLCYRLLDKNMAEIARELKIPRGSLYEKLAKIREAFIEAGLENYL